MAESSAITALSRIELAAESVPGQAEGGMTALWRGTGSLKDARKILEVSENIGMHAPQDNTVTVQHSGELSLEQALTFEQLLIVLSAGYALTGPVADGAGTGQIWTANMPAAGSVDVPTSTYTVTETHDTGGETFAEYAAYAYVREYSIKGTPGDALHISSAWNTGLVSLGIGGPALDPVLTHVCPFGAVAGGGLYIDDADGTIGATAIVKSLIGYDLAVKTGLKPAYTAESLAYSILKYTRSEVLLKVTFEMNGSAQAEKTAWRSHTTRQVRIKHTGAALETGGTAYDYHTLILDVVGRWLSFDVIDTQDGNDIVVGTLKGMYNADADLYHRVIVVNELDAVP